MPEGLHGYEPSAASAEVGPVIEEEKEPIVNVLRNLEKIYYGAGVITRPSRFARTAEHPEGEKERPALVRTKRAEIFKKMREAYRAFVQKTDHIRGQEFSEAEKESLIESERAALDKVFEPLRSEADRRDYLAEQYLNQRDISIDLPGLGKQRSRMVDLVLPDHARSPEAKAMPPIFFVPGLGNDIECVSSLALEAAMRGRRVVVVAYPESFNGQTTPEFVQAVKGDAGFGPYRAFYEAALEATLGAGSPVELWGFSTGGPIGASILSDKQFQERTKQAVFFSPAGVTDQTIGSMNRGALLDARFLLSKGAPNYTFSVPDPAGDKANVRRRDEIFKSVVGKITKRQDVWKTMRVREGGRIVIVSGGRDGITKSAESEDFLNENPQTIVLPMKDAYHNTPLTEPENVLELVEKD